MKKTIRALTFLAALGLLPVMAFAESSSVTTTSAASSSVAARININTAEADAIAGKVKGIGKGRAEAIVSYRKEHGPYQSFDDLTKIKGISESFIKAHWDELNQVFSLS